MKRQFLILIAIAAFTTGFTTKRLRTSGQNLESEHHIRLSNS